MSAKASAPRIEGKAVPVRTLSAAFVAGKPGAAPSTLDYLASTAVSSDGKKASLWTVPGAGGSDAWQVVNIATGDDEARYAAQGARALPAARCSANRRSTPGTSTTPPGSSRSTRTRGPPWGEGATLDAYRARVRQAYGDKLPGSGYARSGKAGGYGPEAATGPAPLPPRAPPGTRPPPEAPPRPVRRPGRPVRRSPPSRPPPGPGVAGPRPDRGRRAPPARPCRTVTGHGRLSGGPTGPQNRAPGCAHPSPAPRSAAPPPATHEDDTLSPPASRV